MGEELAAVRRPTERRKMVNVTLSTSVPCSQIPVHPWQPKKSYLDYTTSPPRWRSAAYFWGYNTIGRLRRPQIVSASHYRKGALLGRGRVVHPTQTRRWSLYCSYVQ